MHVTSGSKVQIAMGEKKMDFDVSRVIERIGEKGKQRVRLTTTIDMPMGKQVDMFDFDGSTLMPLERNIKGNATLKLTYGKDSITGEMGAGGRTMPIQMKLEAPVLGDGGGLEMAVSGLLLGDGYRTTVRIFEPMIQKIRPMKLEVTGRAAIKTLAGKFETFVLKVTPLDGDAVGGGTMHVNQNAPHFVVKSEYKLPSMMGGGIQSAELSSTGKKEGS